MDQNFDVIVERDAEGYYVASVPRLPGCHTQARSLDEVSERIREAIKLYTEAEQGGLAMRWYDEESEQERYIWVHCTHLMTDLERAAGRVAMWREMAAALDNETMARMISKRWGLVDDPGIDSALSAGPEALRRSVCRRILSERGDEIINRCPRCRRVVRTPRARQCLWCGHEWHGTIG